MNNLPEFVNQLNPDKAKPDEPLSKHTTLKIGGPADVLYTAKTTEDLVSVVKLARKYHVPITILGHGSNVLVSDKGIRGIVIKNQCNVIEIENEQISESQKATTQDPDDIIARWESDTKEGTFRGIEFKDLDYDESDKPRVEVTMDSGVSLPSAITYTLDNGLTGLQWYAGIPGTIGGAIFNNIHGGSRFISEVLQEVTVLDENSSVNVLDFHNLEVDYDKSRFHDNNEIILSATFHLYKGNVERAKYTAKEWAKRKQKQPRNSPGCVFANLSQKQKEKFGYPTTATGYIVEHVLDLSGFRIGDAAISPQHHNFIVNEGNATATDYLDVMKTIYHKAKKNFGIELVSEITLLGFKNEEIIEFTD